MESYENLQQLYAATAKERDELKKAMEQAKAERKAMETDVRKSVKDWWENDSRFPCRFCKHKAGDFCNWKISGQDCCAGSAWEWRGMEGK